MLIRRLTTWKETKLRGQVEIAAAESATTGTNGTPNPAAERYIIDGNLFPSLQISVDNMHIQLSPAEVKRVLEAIEDARTKGTDPGKYTTARSLIRSL